MKDDTAGLIRLMRALVAKPDARHSGDELRKSVKVRADALYPLLDLMVSAGWLTDGWELASQAGGSREERRWFELTPDGRSNIEGCLSAIDRIIGTEGTKP